MINLQPVKEFRFPVMADCITPNAFRGKTREEIEDLEVWEGNQQRRLGDLFKIKETGQEEKKTAIALHGDLSKVKRIGARMTAGNIVIEGDVGMHLGEEMRGGKITVHGDAGGWAGSMMRKGIIEIHGDAGHYLGSSYRGSDRGMRGGKIIVHGNVGKEAGAYMRGGLIKIYGDADDFLGLRMRKGTIYVRKNCGDRVGARMKKGKIIIEGSLKSILPTFTIDSIKKKAKIEENEKIEGPFYRFLGDLTENGRGRLYVHKENNSQLARYEQYL
ncbi:MAG: formylmethanofuran dehydrogenase subunit C [Thermoproteota archaeon]